MYFTKGVMKVENSKIVQFDWEIRDAARNDKLFDDKYGDDVFSGSEAYKKQCVENLAGMKAYAPRLIETQDISKVDAVTGATWAHSQFWLLVYKLTKKAQE
jgi:major membrane immunogen (membrane-anchored lipoprotein)